MEPIENAERQRDSLDDGPWQKAVEIELDGIGFDFLHLERVDEPQCHVGDQQESDGLSTRFDSILFDGADSSSWHVWYKKHLNRHFNDGQQAVN